MTGVVSLETMILQAQKTFIFLDRSHVLPVQSHRIIFHIYSWSFILKLNVGKMTGDKGTSECFCIMQL
jgi:hypothetical protein